MRLFCEQLLVHRDRVCASLELRGEELYDLQLTVSSHMYRMLEKEYFLDVKSLCTQRAALVAKRMCLEDEGFPAGEWFDLTWTEYEDICLRFQMERRVERARQVKSAAMAAG